MRKNLGVFALVVLALLLGLLWVAGTATASPMNTAKCTYFADIALSDPWQGEDGTLHAEDWVMSFRVYAASGPDGWRFLGYGVVCLDITYPSYPTTIPHNYPRSTGVVAFVSRDPSSVQWDADKSFLANLEGRGLLWTGTWDGHENVGWGDCHDIHMALAGWPRSDNAGYTADLALRNLSIDMPNWHSGNLSTPGCIQAVVTAP